MGGDVMFYISSKKNDLLGVTDTKDNIEEFYSKEDLAKIFLECHIKINGFTYTGSSFKIEVKNLALISIENLQNGDVFMLNGEPAMKVEETSMRNFSIFNRGKMLSISRKSLLNGDYNVNTKAVSDTDKKAIISSYLTLFPSSRLSLYLGVE